MRNQLLTALHLGRLRPGDRFLSVRRLSEMTRLNRKTIHRAFQELAREGYLVTRPGSGTFVAGESTGRPARSADTDLIMAVNRVRADAASLGLQPETFADFLRTYFDGGLRRLPLAVVECNFEQIGLIARDLAVGLGIEPRPVLLSDVLASPRSSIAGAWGIVTTDCHRAEVADALGDSDAPLYRVSLDASFPQQIVRLARYGPVVMVVADRRFEPVFLRLLRQLRTGADVLHRVRVVDLKESRVALRHAGPDVKVCVSPLLAHDPALNVPEHVDRVDLRWGLSPGAIDGLRARIALDLSIRESRTA